MKKEPISLQESMQPMIQQIVSQTATPITMPWGDNIQCKLDYIIQILLWQNEMICYLKNNCGSECCQYLTPPEENCIPPFEPPCCPHEHDEDGMPIEE